jgi:hypothetical protein
MSVDLIVFAARSSMPAPRAWARAIVDAGFDAELDHEFDVDTFTGYLPCRYAGVDAGFEYLAGPPEAHHLELPADFDFSVTFSTHSDMRELAASTVAAAVLCALARGILYDPQGDVAVPAGDALKWAREQLKEIDV